MRSCFVQPARATMCAAARLPRRRWPDVFSNSLVMNYSLFPTLMPFFYSAAL